MSDTAPPDGRTASLRVRLTPEELRALKLYCIDNDYTVSDFVRWLIKTELPNRKDDIR